MNYWDWAFIILLINVGIMSFITITYFKEIMQYMKDNEFGYHTSNYSYKKDNDLRGVWLIIGGLVGILVSWLLWPVMVVIWAVGIAYIYTKKKDKFNRIIAIMKEKKEETKN
jgi:hypothetical protein